MARKDPFRNLRRRVIVLLIVYWFVGALLSLVIAWLCCIGNTHWESDERPLMGESARVFFDRYAEITVPDLRYWGTEHRTFGFSHANVGADVDPATWAHHGVVPTAAMEVLRSGFPLYCVKAVYSISPGQHERIGWTRTKYIWPIEGVDVFPTSPIIHGLALNGLFYGIVLFALACLAMYGRATRRWLRGDCPACGYNLRYGGTRRDRRLLALGCPECGWRRATDDGTEDQRDLASRAVDSQTGSRRDRGAGPDRLRRKSRAAVGGRASYRRARAYARPDISDGAIRQCLTDCGFKIIQAGPEMMEAKAKASWRSWGEIVRIAVIHSGDHVVVDARSLSRGSATRIDCGKNQQNVVSFFDRLDTVAAAPGKPVPICTVCGTPSTDAAMCWGVSSVPAGAGAGRC
jgi:hypothetical protein